MSYWRAGFNPREALASLFVGEALASLLDGLAKARPGLKAALQS
jgi:hypothetical protein